MTIYYSNRSSNVTICQVTEAPGRYRKLGVTFKIKPESKRFLLKTLDMQVLLNSRELRNVHTQFGQTALQ